MITLHERYIVDNSGQAVEVVLPIADYRALINRLKELDVAVSDTFNLAEWRVGFQQALREAGLESREQIVALTREIRREQLQERLNQ